MIHEETVFVDSEGQRHDTLQLAQEGEALITVKKSIEEVAVSGVLTVNDALKNFKHWYHLYEIVKGQR